jgi:hypothetical protein
LINFESLSNVLSSLLSDLIFTETEYGECLYGMRIGVTGANKEKIIT